MTGPDSFEETKQNDAAERVREILDEVSADTDLSTEECLEIFEEIEADVSGRIDGLKEDLEAQKG